MNEHRYIIGTGYHSNQVNGEGVAWFFDIWMQNTRAYCDSVAIYILASGDGKIPNENALDGPDSPAYWLPIHGDLGHVGDLLSGRKSYQFSGGVALWITLAMLAYMNECDFLYKEQDLLAFGPYVDEMYSAMDNKRCVFGSSKSTGVANSLMLMKHEAIPMILKMYLGTEWEGRPGQTCEGKFGRMEKERPDIFCRHKFGVDKDRPFDVNAPIWYAQKFTASELLQLRQSELIEFDDIPINAHKFSNA
jgi:hypothetical protein